MKRMKKYFFPPKLVNSARLPGLFCALLAKKAGDVSRVLRFKQPLHPTASLPGVGVSSSVSREIIAECPGS